MSCKYNEVKLGDVCIFGDGAHTKVNRVENGIPYLTSKNIKNGYIDLQNVDYITNEDYIKLFGESQKSVRHLQEGDVLIGIIGTFGNCYLYKDNDKFGISSSIAIARPNKDLVNPKFLYYYLSSDRFKKYTDMYKGGSVQGYTNLPTLRKIPLYLPPLEKQEKIADILSSLDDKIELNNEMNKTLEEMAQSIFKRWFVDFEFPNEDGLPYKSSGGEMVESELGMIPKGWEVTNIDDICIKVTSGGTPSRKNKDYYDGDIIWIKTKELNDTFLFDSEEKISSIGLEKSSAKLFPPKTVMIAMYGATVGKLGISSTMITFNQATCGMVVNTEVCCYEYLYLHLINQREKLKNLAIGSAQQNLSVSVIKEYNIIKPIKQIIEKFKNIIKPIYDKIECNQNNTQSLKSLRDELLPKLMRNEKK